MIKGGILWKTNQYSYSDSVFSSSLRSFFLSNGWTVFIRQGLAKINRRDNNANENEKYDNDESIWTVF